MLEFCGYGNAEIARSKSVERLQHVEVGTMQKKKNKPL